MCRYVRRQLDEQTFTFGADALLSTAIDEMHLTARGWDRVRRVARTLADLAGRDEINTDDVAEALTYREDM